MDGSEIQVSAKAVAPGSHAGKFSRQAPVLLRCCQLTFLNPLQALSQKRWMEFEDEE